MNLLKLSFVSSPDYENALDSDNSNNYIVNIKATDTSGNETSGIATITITDVDEVAPLITVSGEEGDLSSEISINEKVSAIGQLKARVS